MKNYEIIFKLIVSFYAISALLLIKNIENETVEIKIKTTY